MTISMTAPYKTIDQSVYNLNQTWYWQEIRQYWVESVGHSVRANIARNAYDHQSYARVEIWSPSNGWLILANHQITEFPCAKVSFVHKELDDDKQDLFIQTADFLFGIAERLIGFSQ